MTNLPSFSATKLELVLDEVLSPSFVSTVIFSFFVGFSGKRAIPPGPSCTPSASSSLWGEIDQFDFRIFARAIDHHHFVKTRAPSGSPSKGTRASQCPWPRTRLCIWRELFLCSGVPARSALATRQKQRRVGAIKR
jgi:hypothetical protein